MITRFLTKMSQDITCTRKVGGRSGCATFLDGDLGPGAVFVDRFHTTTACLRRCAQILAVAHWCCFYCRGTFYLLRVVGIVVSKSCEIELMNSVLPSVAVSFSTAFTSCVCKFC